MRSPATVSFRRLRPSGPFSTVHELLQQDWRRLAPSLVMYCYHEMVTTAKACRARHSLRGRSAHLPGLAALAGAVELVREFRPPVNPLLRYPAYVDEPDARMISSLNFQITSIMENRRMTS